MSMDGFEQRLQLTDMIENRLSDLFDENSVSIQRFGCEVIVGQNSDIQEYIKEPEVNQQASAMIVKFAPDFILLKKDAPKQLYFLDVKHSISPIWADSRMEMLRTKNDDVTLTRARVGVVAREALLSYRRYYPNTIILMASPYNPKVLMAQFADKVRCLCCYKENDKEGYDCNNCPFQNGGFFDIERATNANGSQTPMTNVDMDSFESMEEFFGNLEIKVDEEVLEQIREGVRCEKIEFGNQQDIRVQNKVRRELHESGCNWIDYQVYSKEGNDFFHYEIECFILNDDKKHLQIFESELGARRAGKKHKCKYCCDKS